MAIDAFQTGHIQFTVGIENIISIWCLAGCEIKGFLFFPKKWKKWLICDLCWTILACLYRIAILAVTEYCDDNILIRFLL